MPITFDIQRDTGAAATRVVGRDENQTPCFCARSFMLTSMVFDDGDDLREEPEYAEDVQSWRLRDGRWLIRRVVTTRATGGDARAFQCFSDTMPR